MKKNPCTGKACIVDGQNIIVINKLAPEHEVIFTEMSKSVYKTLK